MKKVLFVLLLALATLPALAQKVKKVEGEFTYYPPETVTLTEAKEYALRQAQLAAIADEFGTIISQSNLMRIETDNERTKTRFVSLGSSDVKGEWIGNIGEPEYDIMYESGMLVVRCMVRGEAREVVSVKIDFVAKVLRNGTEERFESEQFKSGDDLYLLFQSPANGYLAVYLVDDDQQVQRRRNKA